VSFPPSQKTRGRGTLDFTLEREIKSPLEGPATRLGVNHFTGAGAAQGNAFFKASMMSAAVGGWQAFSWLLTSLPKLEFRVPRSRVLCEGGNDTANATDSEGLFSVHAFPPPPLLRKERGIRNSSLGREVKSHEKTCHPASHGIYEIVGFDPCWVIRHLPSKIVPLLRIVPSQPEASSPVRETKEFEETASVAEVRHPSSDSL